MNMERRSKLTEKVGNNFSRNERETTAHFIDSEDKVRVTSNSPTVIKSLLEHSGAEINYLSCSRDGEFEKIIQDVSEVKDDMEVNMISVSMHAGHFKIKSSARKSTSASHIVTTPEEVENINFE